MYLVVTVALVIGLMALLIVGFLSVAHELLSRSIFEAHSRLNEGCFGQIGRESSHPKPRDQEIADVNSNC
jgi:hypothetical protein